MALIFGTSGNDVLDGAIGDDEIFGIEGNDTIKGGKGKDTIYGGSGDDSLDGGEDDDLLSNSGGNDTMNGGNGNDVLWGSDGNEILDGGDGIDELNGLAGNDTYYVRDVYDSIYDTAGNDTAYVSVNFAKIPSTIEKVIYTDGALALPYWIDALIDDDGSGSNFQLLLGITKTWNYSFPSTQPSYDTNLDNAKGWTAFTDTQIARTKQALELITNIFDFKFVESNNPSALNTLTFANNSQSDSAAYAKLPSKYFFGSDIFMDKSGGIDNLSDGTYGALTLIHEIGHALGLKHPFAGKDNVTPYLPTAENKTLWTLMSYTSSPEQYSFNFSPLDIAALQYLYGPSTKARTGNDNYAISQNSYNFIWDGVGNDTLDASALTQGATLYMTPGYWSFVGSARASTITSAGQVTVNFGTVLENLIGSAFADNLYGNDVNNVINGGAGNDQITGGGGNDNIDGGIGIDIAIFSGASKGYKVSTEATSVLVTGDAITDGIDKLLNIERIRFSDKSIAIDLNGNAGISAKVIGAVLGKTQVQNSSYVGLGLSYLDKGMSYSDLSALALTAVGATTNDAVVSTLWKNVIGTDATTEIKAPYIKMLTDGMKVGDLVVLAADTSFNTTNINLVGLAQTGIEYLPVD